MYLLTLGLSAQHLYRLCVAVVFPRHILERYVRSSDVEVFYPHQIFVGETEMIEAEKLRGRRQF